MACFHPLEAFQTDDGKVLFWKARHANRKLLLPCGRCIGCRIDRSRQWAVRCVHEAQMHKLNCFITLTYKDSELPPGGTLRPRDLVLFLKRLRRNLHPLLIRYYACGEYGDNLGRPHYHALLFGYDFPDKTLHTTQRGVNLYTSKELTRIWGHGITSIGAVTFQSAAYVARYIMKKINGDEQQRHYIAIDEHTGECFNREPEYTVMSRNPGIGTSWYEKFKGDIFPDDHVVLQGRHYKTPRFYDKLYRREAGDEALANIKDERRALAVVRAADSTPERLGVREKVQEAKLKLLKRDAI